MEVFLRKHFWVFNLVIIGVAAGFFARATAHMLEASFLSEPANPPKGSGFALRPPAVPHSKDETNILKRNIFCSTCPPIIKPPEETTAGGPAGCAKSTLPLRLVFTGVSEDPRWSMSVICDTSTKECGGFGLSSKLRDATVLAINERQVELEVGNHTECIDLEGGNAGPPITTATVSSAVAEGAPGDDPLRNDIAKGVKKMSESQYSISHDLLDKILGDTSTLARSARIVPNVENGKPNGFKLFAIRPGSAFEAIGLRNGDTIHAINGYDMSSPDKALEVYTKLRRATHLSLSLGRGGQSLTLDYNIQ